MRSLTLRDVPIDVLERVCHFLREETCVLLAIALDNAALDSVLLETNIPLTLWQSTNHSTVQWLVKCNASGASLRSWMIAAEYGWVDVIAHLHKHHGVWCTPQVMDCAAMYNNMDVVRFLARHRTEMCTTAALQHIAKHGTPADWHLLVTADLQWFREEFLDVVGPHLLPATFLALYLKSGQLAEPELVRQAARAGRLDLIKLFHKRERRSTFSTKVLKAAVYSGNLELVKYLHNHKLGRFTHSAIAVAARDKNVNLVRYLVDIVPESRRLYYDPDNPTDVNVTVAMYLTNTDVTEKMKRRLWASLFDRATRPPDHCASTIAQLAQQDGRAAAEPTCNCRDCAKVLLLHAVVPQALVSGVSALPRRPQIIGRGRRRRHVPEPPSDPIADILAGAIKYSGWDVPRLLKCQPDLTGRDMIAEAVETGYDLEVIQTLHALGAVCTPKLWSSHWHIPQSIDSIKFLLSVGVDGGTAQVMTFAAMNGNLELVQFLHNHYSEGCTTDAMDEAAANNYLDIVQFLHIHRSEGCTTKAMDSAASWGSLEMVTFLHENRTEGCTTLAMDRAAQNGYLEVVEFLHRNRTEGCTTDAMDNAAHHRHWDIVQFLHIHRSEGCTTKAMDSAASWGSLEMVTFLHENRTEGCTTLAMDRAAQNGYLEVVEFLHRNRTEGCTTDAMDNAAHHRHWDIVQFLHIHRSEGCTTKAMDSAASWGSLEMVTFLHENRTEGCTTLAMDRAAQNGYLEVVEFLHRNRTEGCTTNAVESAVRNKHLSVVQFFHASRNISCSVGALEFALQYGRSDPYDVVEWVLRNRTVEYGPRLMDLAARHGHLRVVELLHSIDTGGCTTDAMDDAAQNGHLKIVEFLHHNRSEGCTLRAMTDAATNGHLEIVNFLHHHRLEGCDADTMSRAGANGHLDVVKFLAFNRSGGAVVDTAMRAIKGYCFWHPEILHFLHRQGPELRLNSVLATPLSAYDERSALITYVYHRGHKVHVDNDLFTTAAQRGVYSDVKLMYECGIGTDLHSALRQAREQGHRQIARYLELAMRAQQ